MRRTVAGVVLATASIVTGAQRTDAQPARETSIIRVEVDVSASRLTVFGQALMGRAAPTVTLAGSPLTLVPPLSATQLVAELPQGLPAGTYLLEVSRGNREARSDTIDVAIGAVGPQGPPGPSADVTALQARVSQLERAVALTFIPDNHASVVQSLRTIQAAQELFRLQNGQEANRGNDLCEAGLLTIRLCFAFDESGGPRLPSPFKGYRFRFLPPLSGSEYGVIAWPDVQGLTGRGLYLIGGAGVHVRGPEAFASCLSAPDVAQCVTGGVYDPSPPWSILDPLPL